MGIAMGSSLVPPKQVQELCVPQISVIIIVWMTVFCKLHLYGYKNNPLQIEIPAPSNTRDGIIGHQCDKRLESFAPYYCIPSLSTSGI
jgi:hypothetical protein